MVGQLILDVWSLVLDAFFTFNREDTGGDKGTGILGMLEQGRLGRKDKDFKFRQSDPSGETWD